jgi:hypothetical protein
MKPSYVNIKIHNLFGGGFTKNYIIFDAGKESLTENIGTNFQKYPMGKVKVDLNEETITGIKAAFKEKGMDIVFFKPGKGVISEPDINDINQKRVFIAQVETETDMKEQCTIDEFMTGEKNLNDCNNKHLVEGSCGVPYFFKDGFTNINKESKNQLLKILEAAKILKVNIEFILGAIGQIEFVSEKMEHGWVSLYIDPANVDNKQNIQIYFPLSLKDKDLLDEIIEFAKHRKVHILNKMCGTCFPSFYYLVKNSDNISYNVNPDQGLNETDSPDIRKCFKNHK